MWVNGVPQELTTSIPNIAFTPSGVSDDGGVVCGIINAGVGGSFAGVWTLATGVIPLADYLAANGIAVPQGVSLANCSGISSIGGSFVGTIEGPNMQAFVATIPSPGMGGSIAAGFILIVARRRR